MFLSYYFFSSFSIYISVCECVLAITQFSFDSTLSPISFSLLIKIFVLTNSFFHSHPFLSRCFPLIIHSAFDSPFSSGFFTFITFSLRVYVSRLSLSLPPRSFHSRIRPFLISGAEMHESRSFSFFCAVSV